MHLQLRGGKGDRIFAAHEWHCGTVRAPASRFSGFCHLTGRQNPVNASRMTIKRRKFLGLGLSGFAGFSLPSLFQLRARAAAQNPTAKSVGAIQSAKETT